MSQIVPIGCPSEVLCPQQSSFKIRPTETSTHHQGTSLYSRLAAVSASLAQSGGLATELSCGGCASERQEVSATVTGAGAIVQLAPEAVAWPVALQKHRGSSRQQYLCRVLWEAPSETYLRWSVTEAS